MHFQKENEAYYAHTYYDSAIADQHPGYQYAVKIVILKFFAKESCNREFE